jgi:hypothetical protein
MSLDGNRDKKSQRPPKGEVKVNRGGGKGDHRPGAERDRRWRAKPSGAGFSVVVGLEQGG